MHLVKGETKLYNLSDVINQAPLLFNKSTKIYIIQPQMLMKCKVQFILSIQISD